MTIRKGSNIIAGCLNNSYSAGDWINIDQNNEISAKGSNTISLKDNVELYALTNTDTNYPAIFYTDIDLDSLDLADGTTIRLTLFIKTGIDGDFLTYLIAPFTYTNDAFYVSGTGSEYYLPTYDTFSIANDRFHHDAGGAIIYLTSIERNNQYDGIAYMSSSQLLPTQYAVKTYVDANDNDLSSRINTKANDNTVVHLTSTETITGNKIIAFNPLIIGNNALQVRFPNAGLSNRDVITEKNNLWSLIFCDNNIDNYDISQDLGPNHRIGLIETVNLKDQNDNYILMRAYKPGLSTNEAAQIAVGYNVNIPYTTAPACDSTNSIVTTINKSKAANGYFQLGNGLIVNWGATGFSGSSDTGSATFSKSFTSSPKVMITRNSGDTTTNDGGDYYTRKITTTGFEIYRTSTNTGGCQWVAIGY